MTRLSEADRERRNDLICKLYQDGLLLKDIGERVGLSPHMVGLVLKKRGFERPGKPQKKVKLDVGVEQKVAQLWKDGLCASQIAERLCVVPATVSQILTALELSDRSSPRHRYDGIGGIGKPHRSRSGGALQRIAGRA